MYSFCELGRIGEHKRSLRVARGAAIIIGCFVFSPLLNFGMALHLASELDEFFYEFASSFIFEFSNCFFISVIVKR